MKTWFTELADLVWPKKCVGCGKWGGYVCSSCEVGLWEEEQICPTCGRNSRYGLRHKYCRGYLEGLTVFWAYEGIARKLITGTKYKFYFDLLHELTSSSIARCFSRVEMSYLGEFLASKPVVVPVPLYPGRERERGFNQAEIISRSAVGHWSLVGSKLLVRARDTGQQVGKDRKSRVENVRGAFEVQASRSQRLASSVLLVDDVWTTGATMNECAKTLKSAGVKKVWGLVLAR